MLENEISYDGTQLSPHWIFRNTDLVGNSIIGFIGQAEVTTENLVDLFDAKRNEFIKSPRMLHFLAEWFIDSIETGIALQYLFISNAFEIFIKNGIVNIERHKNDLFYLSRKLSVSIVTKSTLSILMHTGFNIETHGTPIPTSGLAEMGIEPMVFGMKLLKKFKTDVESMHISRVKVRAKV